MASVRIIGVPAGEAPLSVREAWVGLILPLKAQFAPAPTEIPGFGVLSGRKTAIGQVFAWILRRHAGKRSVYTVDPIGALEVLKEKKPEAAQWWLLNAPHVISPRRSLGFEVEVCELVQDTDPGITMGIER